MRAFFVVLLMLAPVLAFSETTIVRDRSGKVIEKRVEKGNIVRVYDPSGKLIRTEKTAGKQTEIRDRSGKLIQKLKTQ